MNARPILEKAFSDDDFHAKAAAVANAYTACSTYMRLSVVMSGFPVGLEQWPHLLRAFVDHSLMRMADARGEQYHHEIRWNAARNCRHVRVFKDKWAMTAHFLGSSNFRPGARPAEHRQMLAARNGELFPYEGDQLDVNTEGGYVQILHGGFGKKPAFIHLAIPSRDQQEWPAVMSLDIPPVELVEEEAIRDEMAMKLKQQGGEDLQYVDTQEIAS